MRRNLLFFILLMLLAPLVGTAQDPQFSQFYAAPLYLNPAFAGATQQMRVGINYRNQWPSIEANFQTISAYVDGFIESKNSGLGLLLMRDTEGTAGLNSTMVGLQYAYQLYLTDWLTFRPGFQAAFYNRNVNFSDLTFGSQFDPDTGEYLGGDSGESFGDLSKNFVDISAGGVLYTKNAWLGVAAHHLNTPSQSFEEDADPNELPMKFSFHGGIKIPFKSGTMGSGLYSRPQERSLTPTFQYKKQGEFDQLDMGLYLTLEPIIIGTWYRGLPFKSLEGFNNNESIVLLVGFTKKGANGELFNIGYSYDYTISKLGAGSGGAHEVSISYSWSNRDPRKPPKNVMQIPCPDF
ncbi:type IX secretion system membrane protein PorP/SprF [Fulvivirga maritima]|uniref:PorP/SprF family type IX secretion system membrane protein n=1 Tax=Fulvivirga maritima TaxID=2904247 RepID=UPI001F372435|nr:type IX secretion system membrane protein PorP/SprF [Fulvivirga maritima]UII26994.1 type IX secretion system membrane protein PorP/SprF [Fulvivirga maritima]